MSDLSDVIIIPFNDPIRAVNIQVLFSSSRQRC